MPEPPPNEFGFKRVGIHNWLALDPAWQNTIISNNFEAPLQGSFDELGSVTLNAAVPLEIRALFEVARTTVVYSLLFYPLLTLGVEQLLRVAETAVLAKCTAMNSPSIKNFTQKIEWLIKYGAIPADDKDGWIAMVGLRNEGSHPRDQIIFNLGMALSVLDAVMHRIDALFPQDATGSR